MRAAPSRYELTGSVSSTPRGGRSSGACTPTVRMPSLRAVRATRSTTSPRLAISSVRIRPAGAEGGAPGPSPANAESDERDTRRRPPTRVAERRPVAIQRWTVRGVTPSNSATCRGVSSSVTSRLSQEAWVLLRIVRPMGRALLQEGTQTLLALGRYAPASGHAHDELARRVRKVAAQVADERLGGSGSRWSGREDLARRCVDPLVESRRVRQHLVHQTHGPRALGVEPLARRDHRPGLALTDLGQHERSDDRRQDTELGLREAESGSGLRQYQVGGRAQAHAPAKRRAVAPRDDGYRAAVHGEQHVVQPSGVGLVLLQGEVARGPLPVDVRARTEDRTVPGEDHGTETARRFLAKRCKRFGEGRDEFCVERVPNLWPRQGDSCHDA